MITNYHTHTKWCGHAQGDIEDYIKAAIALGWSEITISDHMPIDYRDHAFHRSMKEKDFLKFNKELDEMKAKYQGIITVRKGMECEYEPERDAFYHQLKALGYEILLLSQHNSRDYRWDYFKTLNEEAILLYTKELCEALDTGYFQICAHPDLIANKLEHIDELTMTCMREIFKCCERNHVLYEINAAALRRNRGYTNRLILEESKKYHLQYVIGSDAHHPDDLYDQAVQEAYQLAKELDLEVVLYHEM